MLALTNLIKYNSFVFLFIATAVVITGCKKETVKSYVYDVNSIPIKQSGVAKPNVKSTIEFVSIAYSDLFGKTIDQETLTNLSTGYAAFGDKKLIEDIIIRNFLNNSGATIPTLTELNDDVNQFIVDTYKKFYNRVPNEFELWQLVDIISNDINATPELIYYAFMTSNEYRYY